MQRIAIFPGSFDPFTKGHEAIVEQALLLFDRVVVAIGYNAQKPGWLPLEQRKALIEELYKDVSRVDVESYFGLTVDFASECGAVAMIRGVRSTIDFEYERGLATINNRLRDHIATVVLFTPIGLADISSSVVRELHSYGRDIEQFMPDGVDISKYINKK